MLTTKSTLRAGIRALPHETLASIGLGTKNLLVLLPSPRLSFSICLCWVFLNARNSDVMVQKTHFWTLLILLSTPQVTSITIILNTSLKLPISKFVSPTVMSTLKYIFYILYSLIYQKWKTAQSEAMPK